MRAEAASVIPPKLRVVNFVKRANLVLMFALELVVLVAPVLWVCTAFESVVPKVLVSFLLLGAIITGWFVIGAQRSTKPISIWVRSFRELVWFGVGVLLLWLADQRTAAIVFGALVVVNLVLRLVWNQLPVSSERWFVDLDGGSDEIG